jgi:hypothetical protein
MRKGNGDNMKARSIDQIAVINHQGIDAWGAADAANPDA